MTMTDNKLEIIIIYNLNIHTLIKDYTIFNYLIHTT